MLTPREKSPLPENVSRGVSNPRHCGSEPKHYQLSYSGPNIIVIVNFIALHLVTVIKKVPGSNPACAGIFSGSSHTSDLNIGTPLATLPGAWRYRVSTGTGRPGVSIL